MRENIVSVGFTSRMLSSKTFPGHTISRVFHESRENSREGQPVERGGVRVRYLSYADLTGEIFGEWICDVRDNWFDLHEEWQVKFETGSIVYDSIW